jgi:hypothetical protein
MGKSLEINYGIMISKILNDMVGIVTGSDCNGIMTMRWV